MPSNITLTQLVLPMKTSGNYKRGKDIMELTAHAQRINRHE